MNPASRGIPTCSPDSPIRRRLFELAPARVGVRLLAIFDQAQFQAVVESGRHATPDPSINPSLGPRASRPHSLISLGFLSSEILGICPQPKMLETCSLH